MRSRNTGWWQLSVLLGTCALAAHGGAGSAAMSASAAPAASTEISRTAIDAAVTAAKRDPNLGGETKVRTLKWTFASQPTSPPETPQWMLRFFEYLSTISALVLWGAGTVAVAVAVIWAYRHFRVLRPRATSTHASTVIERSFVLDIGADSLPEDVGAAALALSRAGRMRESLSLLYRAALSLAVNRSGAVIGASLTEKEALGALRIVLDKAPADYVADLISMRQRVVYAGDMVARDAVTQLCSRFDDMLDIRKTT